MARELKSITRVLLFVFGLAVALGAAFAWAQLASAPPAYADEANGGGVVTEAEGDYGISVLTDEIKNGTVTVDKTRANVDDDVTITATPAAGYKLKQITVTGDMETPMTSTTSPYKFKMPRTSIVVTAEFEVAPTYTVTVTADPAAGGTASADKAKAATGDIVTLSATAADGYEFVEWVPVTKDITIADNKFTMPGSDAEVKATFKAKAPAQFAITYDANGGTGTMSAQTVEAGKAAALSANGFARDGYTFAGWNTAKDGKGTAYADKATVTPTADMTLYAQWQAVPAKHTITFDANGGKGTMDALVVDEGNSVVLTANAFKRDGYTFAGWNTAKDGKGTAYADKAQITPEDDMTLYAQWKKNTSSTMAKTGDTILPIAIGIAAVALIAGIAVALAARKRRSNR